MERFAAIAHEVSSLTGTRCAPAPQRRVTGGSINECYCWPGDAAPMFVKVAPLEAQAMLAAEAAGLAELERSHTVRVRSGAPSGLRSWRSSGSRPAGRGRSAMRAWGGSSPRCMP